MGKLRSAADVFDSSGPELGRYSKRTLFGPWERKTFVAGDRALVFVLDCRAVHAFGLYGHNHAPGGICFDTMAVS
jgi:hypothetical protein